MNLKLPQCDFAAPRRWMIVDDDKNVLFVMQQLAGRMSDAAIECFRFPQQALAAFKAAPESFDLVITDLEMPGIDGIELSRRMRAISPAIKILLTSGSGILTEDEAVERGFCGLLSKPFSAPFLLAALENAVNPPALEARRTHDTIDNVMQPACFTLP